VCVQTAYSPSSPVDPLGRTGEFDVDAATRGWAHCGPQEAAPSLIPTVNGNTVRSFSTHGHQSAAKGSSNTVSRSDIRFILTFCSALWSDGPDAVALNWPFPYSIEPSSARAAAGVRLARMWTHTSVASPPTHTHAVATHPPLGERSRAGCSRGSVLADARACRFLAPPPGKWPPPRLGLRALVTEVDSRRNALDPNPRDGKHSWSLTTRVSPHISP
jgi:hypothetical protein